MNVVNITDTYVSLHFGGAVAIWLVTSSLDRVVLNRVLTVDTVWDTSWARH